MRWLFLLLFVLNACYLVWNLQDAPVRAKDVSSIARGHGGDNGLQLLSEADGAPPVAAGQTCVFIGGFVDGGTLAPVAQRLREADIPFQPYVIPSGPGREHWLRLSPSDRAGVKGVIEELARNINGLKQKIIPCEGIATPGQFE